MSTPGPWKVDPCADPRGFSTIRRDDGSEHGDCYEQPIATVYSDADATLIGAATDLLEAAQAFMTDLDDCITLYGLGRPGRSGHALRAAIAKTQGKEKGQ